jgi:hypothetical protein
MLKSTNPCAEIMLKSTNPCAEIMLIATFIGNLSHISFMTKIYEIRSIDHYWGSYSLSME